MLDLSHLSRPPQPRVRPAAGTAGHGTPLRNPARIVEDAERDEERTIAQRQAATARRDQPRPYTFD